MKVNFSKYKKVYSYIRFSSNPQEKGDSIRRQKTLADEFAKKNNLTIEKARFTDFGVSGFKGDNLNHEKEGALANFIEASKNDKKGLFPSGKTLLLVEGWDRLSRQPIMHSVGLMHILVHECGVDICTLQNEKLYSINAELPDFMLAVVQMSSAFEESYRKSKHLKAAWRNKRNLILNSVSNAPKLTSRCPSWLKLNKKTNTFELNQERVKVVQWIYTQYVEHGIGRTKIAKMLNEQGVKTFGKAEFWRESSVTKILSEDYGKTALGEIQLCEVINGKRVAIGEPINNYYPRIISDELFYRAQIIRKSKKISSGPKGNKLTNLFTGFCKCNSCGSNMTCINKGARSSGPALVCSNAKVGNGCKYKSWNLRFVEQCVLVTIRNFGLADLIRDNSSKKLELSNRLERNEGRLAEINDSIRRVVKAIEKLEGSDALTASLSNLETEKDELKVENQDLKAELQELVSESARESLMSESLDSILSPCGTPSQVFQLRSKLARFLRGRIQLLFKIHPIEGVPHYQVIVSSELDGRFAIIDIDQKFTKSESYCHGGSLGDPKEANSHRMLMTVSDDNLLNAMTESAQEHILSRRIGDNLSHLVVHRTSKSDGYRFTFSTYGHPIDASDLEHYKANLEEFYNF